MGRNCDGPIICGDPMHDDRWCPTCEAMDVERWRCLAWLEWATGHGSSVGGTFVTINKLKLRAGIEAGEWPKDAARKVSADAV